mmetsp:Transcript_100246/g.323448  ORF Transcript_100246/g.323448 Transcript_100246/m.323448 type:complete len:241 (+) Transcript_100246:69-791(+)
MPAPVGVSLPASRAASKHNAATPSPALLQPQDLAEAVADGSVQTVHPVGTVEVGRGCDVPQASMSAEATRKCECITVTEQDLRKYRGNVAKLRACQVKPGPHTSLPSEEDPGSFKSAFESRCRMQGEVIDPWVGKPNPELTRELSEFDLILNQYCPRSPKRLEKEEDAADANKRQKMPVARSAKCSVSHPAADRARLSLALSLRRQSSLDAAPALASARSSSLGLAGRHAAKQFLLAAHG